MESKTRNVVIIVIILLTVAGVVLGLVFGLKGKGRKSSDDIPSPVQEKLEEKFEGKVKYKRNDNFVYNDEWDINDWNEHTTYDDYRLQTMHTPLAIYLSHWNDKIWLLNWYKTHALPGPPYMYYSRDCKHISTYLNNKSDYCVKPSHLSDSIGVFVVQNGKLTNNVRVDLIKNVSVPSYFDKFKVILPSEDKKFDDNMKINYNIILVIRSYNRPNYLVKTLNSILKSDIDLCVKRIIYDDGSNNTETIRILDDKKLMSIPDKEFEVVKNNKNVGCYKSYIDLLDYLNKYKANNTYVCIVDNDIVVKENWINQLMSIFKECKYTLKTNKIVLSGFKPTNAHLNKIYEYYKNFNVRYSVGAVCYFFDINFMDVIRKGWVDNVDWGISNIIEKNKNNYFCCVNKSVVNHIGDFGLHSNGKTDKDNKF